MGRIIDSNRDLAVARLDRRGDDCPDRCWHGHDPEDCAVAWADHYDVCHAESCDHLVYCDTSRPASTCDHCVDNELDAIALEADLR